MSSATIHVVIPSLAIMATGLFPRKTVLVWSAFTLLPDLDFIFNFAGYYLLGSDVLLHRAIGHNIFIGIPTAVLAVVLWRRLLHANPNLIAQTWRERWNAFGTVRWAYPAVLITLYLESHVFLDMFAGGVTPFWPLWSVYVYPFFIIWVNTETGMPSLDAGIETGAGAPALTTFYPWLTPEHLAILLIVLAAAGAGTWAETRGRNKPAKPTPPAATDDEA